ncbi:ATP-binding cassette transporter snq2 [Tilletia horrida]|uniref:ATP-binding cassette transporter snq2 n=1 Tax=Tilletia horrida TaxID=155126 RepID=A0AAN6GMT3_9BASI|nr:ATP-binding cassette transporter snq2 [Tilletia horrida]KAK0561265.1 ATP-binding cassette transporter snq2 [Tilletia horrida]
MADSNRSSVLHQPDSNSPQSITPDHHTESTSNGIDVAAAEQTFANLEKSLSRRSKAHAATDANKEKDVEAQDDDEDEFSLVDYLRTVHSESSQAGVKAKHIGVTWDDLTVRGVSSMQLKIRTFPDAVIGTFLGPAFSIASKLGLFSMGERKILQNFNGSIRPGEMVLVVGRPGSGCSTFLKAIANQREGYLGVDGEVKYGGVSAAEMKKRYRGEVVYCEEDDQHNATLGVGDTVDFALSMKTPGHRIERWQSKKDFRKEVNDALLKMLNISHTKNTRVGSAFVRGVSGGERKRVSIAEMFATRACVLSWDNSTRGLDASTALDFAKSLRIITDILKLSVFTSLYQAGEGIYDQFDKVLVIDNGRCVYFGPTNEARAYMISLGFQDLPRQTTADYLSGCTDPNERRLVEDNHRFTASNPPTPETLEQAYKESEIFKREVEQRNKFAAEQEKETAALEEFRQAVRADKHRGVSKKSQYTIPLAEQVWYLFKRQMLITAGDKRDIFMSYFTSIAIACITGSCFLSLPETAAGGFTRGGVLFIGLLFNALVAFSELPTQMGNRPILYKQQGYCFYRPSALSLAQLAADIPFSLPRILIFSIILYFMCGLARTAGAFFAFFATVYVTFMAMNSLFRVFGTVCQSYDVAARLASIIITGLVLFAGYVIPRDAMRRWLFWISYINPLYYGFSSVMINEFRHLNLDCVDAFITPRGPGYPTTVGDYQTCTLAGAQPRQQTVSGLAYLSASFGYNAGQQWLYFGVVCIFLVGFVVMAALSVEIFEHGRFSSSLVVKKKPNKEEEELNKRLEERADRSKPREERPLDVKSQPFTWEKICYTVPVSGGHRQLLDSVDGFCEPGTLTALMGASGAGKTTLLDVLADRKSIGVISGERLISAKPIDKAFQRGCGYAEQQDIHEFTSTVREALRFSAYLRQPAHVSKEEKDQYVEEIIELLEMQDLAEAMVGVPEFGLSVGDRKRVTIGVELAAKPELLLFLDEPTSGLDGQTAYNVVRFLKKLAAAGQAILCTIHQPNSLLFENFDRLLLLQKGGQVVYFGPVGQDSVHVRDYFAANGAHCPDNVNPAEYMLDAIGAGLQKRVGPRDWADIYKDSELYQKNLAKISEIKERCKDKPLELDGADKEYATPYMTQLQLVLKRALVSSWRQPDYQFTRLFQHAAIALLTGLIFLQLNNTIAALQYRIFGIFILTIVPALILAQTEPYYIMARGVFNREASSKMYSGTVFAMGQLASEIPFSIACAVVFFLLFYFPAGFQYASDRAGYFFAFTLLVELFSVTLAQAIAALSPSIYIAALTNPFLIIIFSLFCGVTIPKPNIPGYWRSWLYQLDPFTRLVGGLVVNELDGLEVRCGPGEFAVFDSPPGMTCRDWAGPFVNASGGYLNNPDATSGCQYCQYSLGNDFLPSVGLDTGTRGRDIGIFVAYIGFNLAVLLTAAKFLRFANR